MSKGWKVPEWDTLVRSTGETLGFASAEEDYGSNTDRLLALDAAALAGGADQRYIT